MRSEHGILQGAEGGDLAVARLEGYLLGRVVGRRTALMKLGISLFGKLDHPAQAAIESIDSTKKLDDLIVRCVKASSWSDLLR